MILEENVRPLTSGTTFFTYLNTYLTFAVGRFSYSLRDWCVACILVSTTKEVIVRGRVKLRINITSVFQKLHKLYCPRQCSQFQVIVSWEITKINEAVSADQHLKFPLYVM